MGTQKSSTAFVTPVDSAVTMATRKVKAQNLESWKREASWCLRLFLPHHSWGCFLPRAPLLSAFIHNFHTKHVVTAQTNRLKLKWRHFHPYFPFVFFARRRHVPRHLPRIFPHGVPQPGEAETKECALPALLQVVRAERLERNKIIYLKCATFHL